MLNVYYIYILLAFLIYSNFFYGALMVLKTFIVNKTIHLYIARI